MKALTICQPYASLIMAGLKRIENRTWATGYRGPLAIHAGRNRKWLSSYDYMARHGWQTEDLPFGKLLGTVELADIMDLSLLRQLIMRLDAKGQVHPLGYEWIMEDEHAEGPACWLLDDPEPFAVPVPWTGQQGLFYVPDDVIEGARMESVNRS